MTDDTSKFSRRTVLKGIGTAGVAATVPTGSAAAFPGLDSDALSPAIQDDFGYFGSLVPTASVVTYGSMRRPQFVVTIDEGEKANLQSWEADDKNRTIHDELSETEFLVSAPAEHVVQTGFGLIGSDNPLSDLAYVTGVDYNLRFDAQPVETLASESEFAAPTGASIVEALSGGRFDAAGLAFSDNATKGSLSKSVEYLKNGESADGTGITVAVLDSGCNTASDSSVFGSRIVAAKNLVTDETGVDAVSDPNGHGTWCCAAAVGSSGVAPGASLLVGKVMGDDGSGTTADIVAGVRWAVEQGADVLSMSLGAPVYSQKLAEVVSDAVESGVCVVIATGNSRQTVRWVASPADADAEGIVRVSATDLPESAIGDAKSAYFAQVGPDAGAADGSMGETRGAAPTVAAPGMLVEATVPDTDGSTFAHTLSGTSMATPQVAGVIAAAMGADSSLVGDPASVVKRMENQSVPAPACGTTEVGAGIPDISLLASNTDADSSQEDERDDEAKARDAANRTLSGSFLDSYFTPKDI